MAKTHHHGTTHATAPAQRPSSRAFAGPKSASYKPSMPLAITLCFDPASASAIETMWQALATKGIDTDRHGLGYTPHITLAIYPDDTPVGPLAAATTQVTRNWESIPVTLSGLGIFPGPKAVLWAIPVVTATLLARHAALQSALPELSVNPHYRTDAWVPHVTLSGGLDNPAPALTTLLPMWRPITGRLNRVDLLRFRPVDILQTHALPP
jgi:2'-5' RNA ligase